MYEKEIATAMEAAARASEYLCSEYAKFQAIPNAPADISTHADRQSQEIILQIIRRQFPDDVLCAEEATDTLNQSMRTGDRIWIVDPIDGTRGFAQKNGEFAVMIGMVDHGQTVLGVVVQPAVERWTFAVLGSGCWRKDGASEKIRCRVTSTNQLHQTTLAKTRSRNPGSKSLAVQKIAPANILESYSAGIKLTLVARGEADLYLNSYDAFHDWDICAGHILVTEAGGKITGLDGSEIQYGLPGAWQRKGLLASNGLVHQEAISRMRDVG